MNSLLSDNIILIAGTPLSLVAGIVRIMLLEDATIIVPAKSAHEIKTLKESLININTGKLVTLLMDYPDYYKAFAIAESIMEEFGRIDLAIICFDKLPATQCLSETDILDWESMIDQNITAYFIGGRIVLGAMKKHKKGIFITVTCKNESNSPLADLSETMQTKMTTLFYNELKQENIKCYQLFVDNTSKLKSNNAEDVYEESISVNKIASVILQLYKGEVANPEKIFHCLSL